jgi:protein-disulfide isomerase
MKKAKKKQLIITVAIIFAIINIAGLFYFFNKKYNVSQTSATSQTDSTTTNPTTQNYTNPNPDSSNPASTNNTKQQSAKDETILKITDSDFYLGDKNAPVTIIEYASLSCHHCAEFTRSAFVKLKEEYINTGKVVFSLRNFPLNNQALLSAVAVTCYANQHNENRHEKFFNISKILFRTQDEWAFDKNFADKLKAIFKLDGMSAENFEECVKNQQIFDDVLKLRIDAIEKLAIKSTPTFYVNSKAIEGFIDYDSMKKVIEEQLKLKQNK